MDDFSLIFPEAWKDLQGRKALNYLYVLQYGDNDVFACKEAMYLLL